MYLLRSIFASMLLCSALSAMESVSLEGSMTGPYVITLPKNTYLVIKNNTTWKLIILYTYNNSEELIGATIVPESELILENSNKLTLIQAVPSGKYQSLT